MRFRLFTTALLALALAMLACRITDSSQMTPTIQSQAQQNILVARALVDANGNQLPDSQDVPLPGAKLVIGGLSALTDASGHAQISLPAGWDQPLTVQMLPPAESAYVLIGPGEVLLQPEENRTVEFLFSLSPQTTPTAPLTAITPSPTEPLLPGEKQILRNIAYCTTVDGVALLMDVHYPQNLTSPAPLVVYIHGGGWVGGDKAGGIGRDFAPLLLERGYVIAAINYRLSPSYQFPAHIQDVQCAIRHLRSNAERYDIDPERIAALGGSAGGHLAALLGTADEEAGWPLGDYLEPYAGVSSRVQAVVDFFGPTDLVQISSGRSNVEGHIFGAVDLNDPKLLLYSPLTHVSADDPPFLILHGDKDAVVPLVHSQLLYEKLKSVGVSARLVVVTNGGHSLRPTGGDLSPKLSELQKIVADFLDAIFRQP